MSKKRANKEREFTSAREIFEYVAKHWGFEATRQDDTRLIGQTRKGRTIILNVG